MTIEWGRFIPVDGVRPAWLGDDMWDKVKAQLSSGGVQEPSSATMRNIDDWVWRDITAIALPAESFVYKALDAGFEPWGGGEQPPFDWDESDVLLSDGRVVGSWGFRIFPDAVAQGWTRTAADIQAGGQNRIIGYHKKEQTDVTEEPTARAADVGEQPAEMNELHSQLDVIADLNRQLAAAIEERDIARQQRDATGDQAAYWIGRYFALKAAHGDMPVVAVDPSYRQTVAGLMQQVNGNALAQ